MTDIEIKKYINLAIEQTIAEYKKAGLIKSSDDATYKEASDILFGYYQQEKPAAEITYAIMCERFDPYFRVVEMYYRDGQTIESIAEKYGVDTSTIVRNKKRLCLAIYNNIGG